MLLQAGRGPLFGAVEPAAADETITVLERDRLGRAAARARPGETTAPASPAVLARHRNIYHHAFAALLRQADDLRSRIPDAAERRLWQAIDESADTFELDLESSPEELTQEIAPPPGEPDRH